ncbi:MAG TPA: nucleotidyltransferase family protein [Candidatus Sulfopaludibacter sp.]|nr:nucleotidyltransferase family protein [Candidatus Sulfopaludibacter sp.]
MSPTKNRPALGVIILGAGASSRMGRPKLLLPWGKTSIVGHLIEQWRRLGAAQIVIVCRPDDQELAAELDRLNLPLRDRIKTPYPEHGMFSSILCAARWSGWRKAISSWAVVLGDQPHLQAETLRVLLEQVAQNPGAICQPAFRGQARHPVILPRDVFVELQRSGAETLKDFLKPLAGRSVQCPVADAGLLLDLDRWEDYEKAVKSHTGDL